jgi:hypothetical protein
MNMLYLCINEVDKVPLCVIGKDIVSRPMLASSSPED